ncbi:MAG: type II toxin-antitoxin system RelE/ParE family toxin [Opitutae bacterium]|nr:type II toxin-antitoxin system RelE/ParE family toxin [Opitutae bacterium]
MKEFREAEGYAADLQVAYDYYRSYSPMAAARFLASYARAIRVIQHNPQACRTRRHGWRQMIIPGHPGFSIFYRELPICWLLGGVLSTVRDPDAIQARLLIREIADEET